MRIVHLSLGAVFIILLLISGCISGGVTESPDAEDAQEEVIEEETAPAEEPAVEVPKIQELPEPSVPEGFEIFVGDIETDKDVYKSAELMKFSAPVDCNMDLEGAVVSATGISGKMNLQRPINLTEGENMMEFEYTLPKCNVCGGIRPGEQTINIRVHYNNDLIAENSASVEIQQ